MYFHMVYILLDKAYSVLVEEVEDHVGQSGVAPVPVHQQELLEMAETWESKVTRHHRLQHSRRTQHSICIPLTQSASAGCVLGNKCWKIAAPPLHSPASV